MTIAYDFDVIAWANEQAQLLRSGRFDLLDIEHLADEVEDVGKSEKREFENRMAVLLAHLLKWKYQPERRTNSWSLTIKDQRDMIARRVKKTPSLKPELSDQECQADIWSDARDQASKETGLAYDAFPLVCPWSVDEVVGDWLPD